MKVLRRGAFAILFLLVFASYVMANHDYFYFGFADITQENPEPAQSLSINPAKLPPEINFFESDTDLNNINFISHNVFANYVYTVTGAGINGGATNYLNNNSIKSLAYSGDSPGKMVMNSFFGGDYFFDSGFSKFTFLVFDIQNVGTTDVSVIPRIGPNGLYSGSSMYYAYNSVFTVNNERVISPGDTGTFVFKLGAHPDFYGKPVVWDYYDDPSNSFELEFQPGESGFSVLIDNIGLSMVPEPGAILLFAYGLFLLRRIIKK